MISYQHALEMIHSQVKLAQTRKVAVLQALGGACAVNVMSPMNVPSFRNSAMDGFAVRVGDIASATTENPVTLKCLPPIAAGDASIIVETASAQPIMTGAIVPSFYEAVVPIEEVKLENNTAIFSRAAKIGAHIREIGEDVVVGQILLQQGECVTPEHIMVLSSVGIREISIYEPPKLHMITTGNEIIDDASGALPIGKIYNSNAPYLLTRCAEENINAQYEGIIPDDAAEFERRLAKIPAGAVIISTGAVSKGQWDFIPESLKKLGAQIHFHRVNIRPGKPILFATLPNGSYYFGLPGNPISTAVGFQFFVMPLLRTVQGLAPQISLTARLELGFKKTNNFQQFLKANITVDDKGQICAQISKGQESFKISPLASANAWVILEEDATQCPAGTLVKCIPFGRSRI